MNPTAGITAFLVFCAVVFGTVALALTWEVMRDWLRRREVAKRLKPVLADAAKLTGGTLSDELIRDTRGPGSLLAHLGRNLPFVERTEQLLRDARVDWRPETFFLLSVGIGFGLGLAAYIVSKMLLVAAVLAAMGAFTPYFYVTRKRKKRLQTFEEEFPESIDLLTRAIRAGHPLASGMRMVADEGPSTVAEEFRQTSEEHRFGLNFNDAMIGLVDRVDLVDVRIFTTAVLIQREVGGNLAEILDNLAQTIRGRFYIRRQLRVYTAQGRLSGYALALLPVVVGFLIFLMQPEHIGLLFNTTLGWVMVVVALTLQVIGSLWIRKIIDIDI
jgi:tight adherence protein B